jgi:dihydrofolate reductase
MRKVIYGGACSLDGFFAGADGAIDWLHFSKDVQEIMKQSWATADTLLFGRKTFDFAGRQGGGGASKGIKSYLFSRTLTQSPSKSVELVTTDAGDFIRALKAEPGKDMIVMSGGNLAASLLKAGVIDEVGLNIHPVLLGSGVPAFLDAGRRVALELIECRQLEGGCVFVRYHVRQQARAARSSGSRSK